MQPPEAAENPSANASPSPPSMRGVRWLFLLLLLFTEVAVRLFYLARKPFWFDECFSVEVARIGWGNFLRLLWWREANMSLYYLLLRVWLYFGQREFFIRSLSVVFAAATLPAIYWLAKLLYDRRVALIAVALFTLNAYNVRYAQEARSYALLLLLATLSSGLLIAVLRERARRYWLGYVIVSILAVYAHLYALLLLAAHWIAVRLLSSAQIAEDRPMALPPQMRRAWITIGCVVLPLLIFVGKTGAGPIRWIKRPGVADVLEFFEHLAGSESWILLALFAAACVAAVVPTGRRLFARGRTWEVWRLQFLLIWLFFPVLLTVLLSFARPVFLGRYMIFCLPALLILVAMGLARLPKWWLLGPALVGILLLSFEGIVFVYGHDFDNERDASGAATGFILDHADPQDGVIFHIADTRIAYEFFRSVRAGENTASRAYTGQLGPKIVFPYHGVGLDYRDFTGKPTADFLGAIGASCPRVWIMLMNNGSAENPDPTTTMLTKVMSESFPKEQRWQFTKVEVRLYSQQ